MDFDKVCKLVGHLWLTTQLERIEIQDAAGRREQELLAHLQAKTSELEAAARLANKERDEVLALLAGRNKGEA